MRKLSLWWPSIASGTVFAANLLLNIPNLPTMLGLPLSVWLIGFLLIVQIVVMAKQISDFENASPNIVTDSIGVEEVASIPENLDKYGGSSALSHLIADTNFILLYVDFLNKPKMSKDNPARGVQAFIEYFDKENNKVNQHYGRWIGMPEEKKESIHRYIDIPPDGHTIRRLGIALVRGRKGNDFALLDGNKMSNDYEFLTDYKMPPGEYTVKITMSGSNFSEPPTLILIMKNSMDELSIHPKSKKDRTK
jgi:hypothetical protein